MTIAFIDEQKYIENAEALMISIKAEIRRRCSEEKTSVLFCGYGKMESIALQAVKQLRREGRDIETVLLVTTSNERPNAYNYDKIIKINLSESVTKEYEIACKISYIISQSDIIFTARHKADDEQSPLFKTIQSLDKEIFTLII